MSREQIIAALDRAVTVDITTTRRRSSLPRRIEIWMVKVDGIYLITGAPGARDWYANLQADRRLILHLKGDFVADLPAVAVPILGPPAATGRSHRTGDGAVSRRGRFGDDGGKQPDGQASISRPREREWIR